MYQLYIANRNYSSWSLRPWLLMKVLNIDFQEVLVPFDDQGAGKHYHQFSPSGKVPCLVVKKEGITVWDSLAIIEFLADSHAHIWPIDKTARAFARSTSAEMHAGFTALRRICSMNCSTQVQLQEITEALAQDIRRINEIFETGQRLFGGPYLAGSQFTAVDAMFAPIAFRVQTYQLQLSADAMAYCHRLLALSAMQSWQRMAQQESPCDKHESATLVYGQLIADFRLI